jgi:hypothetical protein
LPQRDKTFVGRTAELDQLHDLVEKDRKSAADCRSFVVLRGSPGIGKSQLVLEYAHRHKEKFTSIFWISAQTVRHIERGLIGISQVLLEYLSGSSQGVGPGGRSAAAELGLPISPDNVPGREFQSIATKAALNWLGALSNRGWLLILDGFELGDEALPLIPINNEARGSVIVTSRQPLGLSLPQPIGHMEIGGLDVKDSKKLVLSRFPGTESSMETPEARENRQFYLVP